MTSSPARLLPDSQMWRPVSTVRKGVSYRMEQKPLASPPNPHRRLRSIDLFMAKTLCCPGYHVSAES